MAENEFRHIVRVANTDLDGKKPIMMALKKIKGISFMLSNAVCYKAAVPLTKKAGDLTNEEVEKLSDVILHPVKFNIPTWLLNRRGDPIDGTSAHLVTGNLVFAQENDLKTMKKTRSYKGIRHIQGLPVRGQRTKSNFRKNKGKVSLGVKVREGAKSGRT